ncbi:alpha/beta fold hydrolase [Branchiibius cervicis]|uniref:Alpha/beta fold hydrolase n=1 Tax=Branchiibius cervicis TaxID=908252 RepID=A0ABW2AXS4_9MICO
MPADPQAQQALALVKAVGTSLIFIGAHPGLADEPQSDPALEMERLRAHATSLDNIVGVAAILGSYPDRTDGLASTGLPVHLVYGANDEVWPQAWYAAEAARLHAPRTVLEGAGHSAQLDKPQNLATALTQFWSNSTHRQGTA